MLRSLIALSLTLNTSLIVPQDAGHPIAAPIAPPPAIATTLPDAAAPVDPNVPPNAAQTIGQQIPPVPQTQRLPILPNPLFDRIPGVAQTPGIDWIKPGTRLVFFSTNANTQTNPGSMGMRRDPNGTIVDDKGNRWTMDENSTGETGGGVGFTVIDVVAVDQHVIVLDHRMYFLPNVTRGPAIHVSSQGELVHPTGGDFFLHPRLLAQVPSTDTQTVNIIRQQYDLKGRLFPAMRVTIRNNGLTSSVYDLNSGVLLFCRASQTQSQGQVLDRNGNIVNAGATASGTNTFMSTREANLPWKNSQMPAWVKQTKRLRYAGQMISRTTTNEGLPDNSTAMSADLVLKETGGNWSLHEMTSEVSTNVAGVANVPSVSVLACGPASFDGVWKDPNILKQLRTGQALDQDQAIGVQMVVEYAGAGNDGRPIVAITSSNEGQKSTSVYDANDGRLIQMVRTEPMQGLPMLRITQLNLVAVE